MHLNIQTTHTHRIFEKRQREMVCVAGYYGMEKEKFRTHKFQSLLMIYSKCHFLRFCFLYFIDYTDFGILTWIKFHLCAPDLDLSAHNDELRKEIVFA